MKKLIIVSFLTVAASLAYAGGSCCEKKVDSKDKDVVAKTGFTLAGGDCGGEGGCEKKIES